MKDIVKWFDGDELAAHVWRDKYALKKDGEIIEKTPDDTINRIVNEFYRIEQIYKNPLTREEIYSLFKDFKKVIPAGSPLFGIGNPHAITSLSNCYVVDSPVDSYGGILKTDEELVQLMKRRGGVGVDISTIRPSGAFVSNSAGTSTGIIPFMDRYSNSTKEVAQEGRRGALLLSIRIDHPDIEQFITSKDDLTKINGANISIKITDDFMKAVETDGAIELWHLRQKSEVPIIVSARKIWDKVVHQAWKTAEPGLLFWDRIIAESPADCYDYFQTISTNPCFHPDTIIETVEGRKRISEINKPTSVYSMDENGKLCVRKASASFVSKKNTGVIKITLRNGSCLVVTPDHKVYTHNRGWVEAGKLKKGDRVVHLVRNRRGKRYSGVKLTTQEPRDYIMEHRLVYQGVKGNVDELHDIHHKDGNTFNNSIGNLELLQHGEHSRYTAINDNPQTHQVRDTLGKFIPPIKKYLPKIENLPEELKTNLKNKGYNCIYSIEKFGKSDVYDIQVEGTNCLLANNMIAHNCGELPLCAYDSCRLMHVNVYEFIVNPFTDKAYFDIDSYKDTVFKAQRLMDDMIDLEEEKLNQIISKIENDPEHAGIKFRELQLWTNIRSKLLHGRRTGLNPLLGLADAFAALNLKYDSDEAIAVAEMIAANAAVESYRSSINLALERGSFIDWNYTKEADNSFLNRIFDLLFDTYPEYIDIYEKHGRRNIANLTIPPSGSVSILAQVTSGIEPVFNLSYTRKRKVNSDYEGNKYQDKTGEWWEEYTVYHPKFQTWKLQHSEGKSPYDGCTTNEIDPLQKVRMQGIIQKWIDHSISITTNLPETITEQQVSDIYMEAWKSGCKGCTIYREGSREGILTNKKKVTFEQHDAPKRPKIILHDIHNVVSKGQKWTICVGLLENKPYEVFAFNHLSLIGKYSGEVVKQTKGKYDLHIRDIGNFENITEHCTDEENLLTRMISTSLRHGADIRFVTEQLDKSEGDITSFGKGIARVLKKYINNTTSKEVCPECDHNLTYEGGCAVCSNCGYSKCS